MLFRVDDIKHLLKNKHIVILGDSVQRCIYKDLILSLQDSRFLHPSELKQKAEDSVCGDNLLYRTELSNGRDFCEIREFQSPDNRHLVHFYFLTRCFGDRMEMVLEDFKKEMPDVVIMNSCMWDISRYGPDSEQEYYMNMNKLCSRLREVLRKDTMFLWTSTLPISSHIATGFLLENISFLEETLRIAVLEANYHVAQIVTSYGFDVLDLHYYMRALINHREKDGCHWDGFANRHITNLICIFLYDSWGIPLPKYTIEKIRANGTDLNLRHFNYVGMPTFVKATAQELQRLQSIAANVTDNSGSAPAAGKQLAKENSDKRKCPEKPPIPAKRAKTLTDSNEEEDSTTRCSSR